MTRRADLRIDTNNVLRKYLRGLAVIGYKPPGECDSMDSEDRDLYRNYTTSTRRALILLHTHTMPHSPPRTRCMLRSFRSTLDGVFLARG